MPKPEITTAKSLSSRPTQLQAGAVTTAMSILNIAVGLGFQAFLAAELGLGSLSDAFQLAWGVATFEALCFASIVITTIVPRLQLDKSGRHSIGDTGWLGTAGACVSVGHLVLGLQLEGPVRELLAYSSPVALLAALATVPQSLAYLQRRFALASAGPVANGLAVLAVALFVRGDFTARNLGIALSLGYVAQLAVLVLPHLGSARRSKFAMARAVPIRVAFGSIGFTCVTKFQPMLERLLSSALPLGATATLGFSQKLTQGLLLLAAFGLSTASLPRIAELVRSGQPTETARAVARAIGLTFLCSSIVISLALPGIEFVVSLVLERGAFTSTDSIAVSNAVLAELGWVIGCALTGVLTAYLYAAQLLGRVLVASVSGLTATWLVSELLAGKMPYLAVPVASSVGSLTVLLGAFMAAKATPAGKHLCAELARILPLFVFGLALVLFAVVVRQVSDDSFGPTAIAEFTVIAAAMVLGALPPIRRQITEVLRAKV